MKPRKGSALLVVLGLMAFLSISALAFAAYMRYSRIPSSYTRRSSSARNLVKAALARAIDQLDKSVNNHIHPNLNGAGGVNPEGNKWICRVLTGKNGDDVPVGDTVSPLTLEGLAYIPPNLVDPVRYLSRKTTTAMWHTLDFDAGRYSFCVIDISDYLDVNRMFADEHRTSASGTRLTLAHLFDTSGSPGEFVRGPECGGTGESDKNASHSGPGDKTPEWDKWMEDFRNVDEDTNAIDFNGKVPLVSLGDLSLALGKKGGMEPLKSPFWEFVVNHENEIFDSDDPSIVKNRKFDIRRMTFCTDGLFPVYKTVPGHPEVQARNLADKDNQPFSLESLKSKNPKLTDSLFGLGLQPGFKDAADGYDILSGLGCAALRDYLDPDRVPVSLAVPTTERVPMICGIETVTRGEFRVDRAKDGPLSASGQTGNSRIVEQTVKFKIGGGTAAAIGQANIDVLARFSLFFAEGQVPLRPKAFSQETPHIEDKQIKESGIDRNSGLINVKLAFGDTFSISSLSFPQKSETETVKRLRCPLSQSEQFLRDAFDAEGNELLSVTLRWTQSRSDGNSPWRPDINAVLNNFGTQQNKQYNVEVTKAHCGLPPLKWEDDRCRGVDTEILDDDKLAALIQSGAEPEVSLKGAVWLRVTDEEENVVDMVPACYDDDAVQLGTTDDPGAKSEIYPRIGTSYPLMLYSFPDVKFKFSLKRLYDMGVRNGMEMKAEPQSVMTSDPRYNHAPEHWFQTGDISAEAWAAARKNVDGADEDVFMSTSDSGYMQSKYEIAHLPRTAMLEPGGGITGKYENPQSRGLMYEIPKTFDDTVNRSLVWKTYSPWNDDELFRKLPWTNDGPGMMMTPYSDNLNNLCCVFANTPLDWKRSSTNLLEEASGDSAYAALKAKDFNERWAWNCYSGRGEKTNGENAEFLWEDVVRAAENFRSAVRSNPEDWETVWKNLGWSKEGQVAGIETGGGSKIWSADRRFFYGFWKDCFAPKQQLYIVLVRAEAMMLSVGDLRMMPPQLGARAVAVVWRDPAQTPGSNKDGYPHRTRVLFYRQFD